MAMLQNTTILNTTNSAHIKNAIESVFLKDDDLHLFFDPSSKATTNEQRAEEIYEKCLFEMAEYQCQFYIVLYGSIKVAYWLYNKDTKRIVSFGVMPIYRKDLYLVRWFRHVHGSMFWIALYTKNQRAIKFLIKNGMVQMKEEEGITYLEN